MSINIIANDSSEHTTITLEGDLSIYNAKHLSSEILSYLEKKKTLVFDIAAISECDTAGIQVLIWAKRECTTRKIKMQIVHHSEVVLKLYGIYGLIGFFKDKIRLTPEQKKNLQLTYGVQKQPVLL